MNAKSAGSVVLILGGVGLVYLAITGYAGNVWNALKGDGIPADAGTGQGTATQTQKAGGVVQRSQGGGVSRALGRGMAGQVSNRPVVDKGVYYPTPAGGINATDEGIW